MYVSVWGFVHVKCCRVQKQLSDLELDLQAFVSCSIWVLGTKPQSSERETSTFNPETSPQPLKGQPHLFRYKKVMCTCMCLSVSLHT